MTGWSPTSFGQAGSGPWPAPPGQGPYLDS